MSTQTITIIFLVIYGVVMLAVGLMSISKTKTMNEFLLGGRKIGPWMSAFAYGTTYFSAVIFIGYAGRIGWGIGIGSVLIGVGNALLGSLLAWLLLANKTRVMTHNLGARTMPEFFKARYNSNGMKAFAAIVIFIFLVPYSASVYTGLSYLFNCVFPGVSMNTWMLIIAALTAIYLVLGGYIATAMTDFIQGIVMIVGVVLLVAFITTNPAVGGIANGIDKLKAITPNGHDLVSIWGGKNWLSLLSLIVLTSLGAWGLPQMIHKFYAIKDKKSIKSATVISTLFALLIAGGAYLVGSFGRLILNNAAPLLQNGKINFDAIIPDVLVKALSVNVWSNIVFSIIILLVLSASMSTLASLVLVSSSAITVDLASFFGKKEENKQSMFFMRIVCFLFIALSYIFASMNVGFIIEMMSFSWGTVAGCFLGAYIWGLYWKGTTKLGAWAGMIAGFSTTIMLILVTTFTADSVSAGFTAAKGNAPLFGMYAMIVSLVAVPLVSLITPKFSKEHNDMVFTDSMETEQSAN